MEGRTLRGIQRRRDARARPLVKRLHRRVLRLAAGLREEGLHLRRGGRQDSRDVGLLPCVEVQHGGEHPRAPRDVVRGVAVVTATMAAAAVPLMLATLTPAPLSEGRATGDGHHGQKQGTSDQERKNLLHDVSLLELSPSIELLE